MHFIPDTKPNQPGTALTKRKERSKKAENGQKDSLRPNSPRADKSDASDDNMNGDAEDLDVSVPCHACLVLKWMVDKDRRMWDLSSLPNILWLEKGEGFDMSVSQSGFRAAF